MRMDKKIAIKELSLLKRNIKNMRLAAEEWKSPWQTLIAIILSARTRDEKTIKIAKELFNKYPNAKDLANANIDDVKRIIRPINYYNNKSRHIIHCSKIIIEEYHGVVPHDENELLKLSGVGRKTMNVFLSEMGKDTIGVDTHVAYISQRFGWTKNSNPEKIERDLKDLFPKRYWRNLNSTLVRFGKSNISKKSQNNLIDEIRNKAE
jgi:endonuclease III